MSGNITTNNFTPNLAGAGKQMQIRKSHDRISSNILPANQIVAEDYRRLMMIKSPSEYNNYQYQNSKRYTILSDNFSKINVKQAVALQSGLG